MKITDYALVFIGVTLPIMLIAYVNITLTIRTFQQEMYYQKVIDTAVEDAISEMKRIENEEITNSYGYSGEEDKKLSINPKVAQDAFFKSFYGSLNILDDTTLQSIVQIYVPVIAIMDYNGVYISSIENVGSSLQHVLKPKKYYTLMMGKDQSGKYHIKRDDGWHEVVMKDGKYTLDKSAKKNVDVRFYNNIEFTIDDRIFNTQLVKSGYKFEYNASFNFYISDYDNNASLFDIVNVENGSQLPYLQTSSTDAFIDFLKEMKKQIMNEVITREITYAANKNNEYARQNGISYNFYFSNEKSNDDEYDYVNSIGVLALVQGIKVGDKYLNYKAYNVDDVQIAHNYYLTNRSNYGKLYHKTSDCPVYNDYVNDLVEQKFVYSRETAASKGYYPCPICNP